MFYTIPSTGNKTTLFDLALVELLLLLPLLQALPEHSQFNKAPSHHILAGGETEHLSSELNS